MRRTALAASVAALVMAPAAMAQGGAGGGGGGTGGGGTTTTVAGGGGGGTGGLNKGGVKDVGAPAVPACATLTGVGAPVGYYSTWAALWNQYTVRSCSTATESLSVTITNTNVATGAVDFSSTAPVSLTAGQNSSSVVDNDFAPFSTDYNVEIQVRDSNGTVLDTQSLLATTPPQR